MTLAFTFLAIMAASVVIGWAAELTAVHLSAGIALAVLAWLQTSPEFAVEATIAWHRDVSLALANLTGSLRLLLGLGWPMIFFVHWANQRRRKNRVRDVQLPASFSVEAIGLAIPVIYFLVIYFKRTWSFWDGLLLCSFYGVYFWLLNVERKAGKALDPAPPQTKDNEDEGEAWIVEQILKRGRTAQLAAMAAMFCFGGTVLWFTVHPFVDSLKETALRFGVSEFVFIQWIAPIASEFPEKVTAFRWATKASRVPYAIVNMLSSVTSQWTLLAGLVPIIFSMSAGHPFTIELGQFQRTELLLTIAQSALAVAFLADLRITAIETIGIFGLWIVQFALPNSHHLIAAVYALWTVGEIVRLVSQPKQFKAWTSLRAILKHAFS